MNDDTLSGSAPVPEQAFLTGRDLYLRGAATSDAASVNRWRNSLFPMNPDLAEEKVRTAITGAA